MDTNKLCELTSGADSLRLRPLVDLTSRALARMIEGTSPEEIRHTFHLPDDLTEVTPINYLFIYYCQSHIPWANCLLQEEKLEPLRIWTNDPHIRLLNRLYARKRKELKIREKAKVSNYHSPIVYLNTKLIDDIKKAPWVLFLWWI